MKNWLKISIVTEPVLVESLSDFLIGVIGAGVEIGIDDHSHFKTINVFVEKENPDKVELDKTVAQVVEYTSELAEIFKVDMPEVNWQIIGEEDWGNNWKKHFTSFTIAPGLVIVPSWEEYEAATDEKVLVMDPGMAFGTGHHATTALVLELMEEELKKQTDKSTVLDVGTGTGILGMAAILFGAKRVFGIDNDSVAVMVAEENIKKNGLSSLMTVSNATLSSLKETYPLVVANIIHDVLQEMAADLYRLIESGGKLILSGILQGEQVDSITKQYEDNGLRRMKTHTRDEWAALVFKKL